MFEPKSYLLRTFMVAFLIMIQLFFSGEIGAQMDTSHFVNLLGEATKLDKSEYFDASIEKLTEAFDYAAANGGQHYALRYALTRRCVAQNRYQNMEAFWNDIQLGKKLAQAYGEFLPEGIEEKMSTFFLSEEGHFLYRRGELFKAEKSFKSLIEYLLGNQVIDSTTIGNSYDHLGLINGRQNNLSKSLSYFKQARSYLTVKQKGTSYEALMLQHEARAQGRLGKNTEAYNLFEQSMQLFGEQIITSRQQRNRYISSVRSYARFLLDVGEPKRARKLLRGSLASYTPSDPQYIYTYLFLGEVSEALNEDEKAKEYYLSSLSANKTSEEHRSAAQAHLALGKLFKKRGNLAAALSSIQQSLAELNDDFSSSDPCDNPEDIDATRNWGILLEALKYKVAIVADLAKSNQSLDHCAKATYSLANLVLDKMRAINIDPADRLTLNEDNYQLFEAGMQLYLDREDQDLAAAFIVSEQSKANTLITAINKSYVQNFNIPEPLLRDEKDVHDQLRTTKAKWEKDGLDSLNTHLNRITALNLELEAINEKLKANYPEYYALRYSQRVNELATAQARLKPGELMVTYFMGESTAYAIVLSSDEPPWASLLSQTPKEIAQLVDRFRHALLDFSLPDNSNQDFPRQFVSESAANAGYATDGKTLYNTLLATPIGAKIKKAEKLIIIPDGVLNYLPFDALLTDKVEDDVLLRQDWSSFPFLGRTMAISYCYSATMLGLMEDNETAAPAEAGLLVFHLQPFTAQVQEIKRVLNRFPVRILEDDATRESYLNEAIKYPLLHFSVHGIVNDASPSLSYLELREQDNQQNKNLFLSDIYGQDLPAALVFASACEAGLGSLKKGEGLLSLTRGFAYAGAKSMITTIWPIMNGSSAKLVAPFYKDLQAGLPKDQALKEAKRSLMQDPTLGNPYYWAGFIPIGDMEPLDFESEWSWGKMSLILLSLGSAYFVFSKLKSSYKSKG